MYTSKFLLTTLKETPADAELISHQLMLRAGLISKLASGIYTWSPLGYRIVQKVQSIVREEMNNAGALELLMPAIQPAELWLESNRWDKYGKELLKITDRHQREFCFGPTHEEVITNIARSELHSYKQLPLNVYQIQTKFRDEIRPRFGVMRAREFIMKDAYSFDLDRDGLQKSYDAMFNAYTNIFTRLGLQFRAVLADTGSIGGSYSHEFQVIAQAGEDIIVYSDESDYAANIEKAESLPKPPASSVSTAEIEKIATPKVKTISDLQQQHNIAASNTIKTLIVHGVDDQLIALVLRGDHQLNEVKVGHLAEVAQPLTLASDEQVIDVVGCGPGSLGPLQLPIPYIVDRDAAALVDFVLWC